jgi:hypothetical protein
VNLEMGSAIALVGAGIFQIHDVYTQHAGSLADIRQSSNHDLLAVTKLQDADVLVGAITLVVGGSISLATGKVYPLALAVLGYALIAAYYHSALNTRAPITEADA